MATDKTKTEAGQMPCPNDDCESHDSTRDVIVFENGNGTLSYTCDKCGASQYARPGQKVHAHWLRRMGKAKAGPPGVAQPASVVPVASSAEGATDTMPPAAQVSAKPRAAFSLGDL